MPRLLHGAVHYARDSGAEMLEAFPVDRESPSYRFMGYADMFERAGFSYVGMAGKRRRVMRLSLKAEDNSRAVSAATAQPPLPNEDIVS